MEWYQQVGAQNPILCHGSDQIKEAMADWFAAEVLPEYMRRYRPELTSEQYRAGYSNVMRSQCKVEKKQDGAAAMAQYPTIEMRIQGLLLANPLAREQIGCATQPVAEEPVYCPASDTETL